MLRHRRPPIQTYSRPTSQLLNTDRHLVAKIGDVGLARWAVLRNGAAASVRQGRSSAVVSLPGSRVPYQGLPAMHTCCPNDHQLSEDRPST